MIRRIKPIAATEENFRVEPVAPGMATIRRDSVEPVPIGTLVVKVFRVVGYDQDCDGSLMARLEQIDNTGDTTGWSPNNLGMYPDSTWVLDTPEGLDQLAEGEAPRGRNLGHPVRR